LSNDKITALDPAPFEFGREAAQMMQLILQSDSAAPIHKFHEAYLRSAISEAEIER
jgi:hypothetical protein